MFNDPLTVADQYWCGYIRADGCLDKRGNLIFGQKERYPVVELSRFLGLEETRVLSRNYISNFGPNPMNTVSSRAPYSRLKELGVKENLFPELYDSKHFWRGLLDGDGSIQFCKNAGKLYPTICWSGNQYDMERCSEWVAKVTNGTRPKVGAARSIFRVGLNGARASDLATLLYKGEYSANILKATRAAELMLWQGKFRRQ